MRYSFTLTNGAAAVPADSTLSFSSSSNVVSLTNSSCFFDSSPVPCTTDESAGSSISDEGQRAANTQYLCTVDVIVNATHAAASKVPVFNIVAKYTGSNTSRAFFIPNAATNSEVPVYTGGILATAAIAVVDNDNSTFFQGEMWQLSWPYSRLLKTTNGPCAVQQ